MIRVNRDIPAVIMANIGTTMRGAIDDIPRIRRILDDQAVVSSYIHADAALSGMILPFVPEPQAFGFDAGIDSISVSGHKLIGAPLPCGVVLTKRPYVDRVGRAVEYVGVNDTTLSGSRNGADPSDALVRSHPLRRRWLQGTGRGHAQYGGICGAAVQ